MNGENLRTKRPVRGVCPSLPGYGFSDKPAAPGWGIERISDAWCELMARLGYRRFGAQGSDWSTSIATSIGQRQPDRVAGIHLMPPLAPPDPATLDDLTGAERAALATLREADEWGSGYSTQQSTRPQTVGYGLVDSPAALCAWIVEKFWSWTDSGGDLHRVITRDELLDNLMLYWLPGNGASSALLYWESLQQVNEWISGSAGRDGDRTHRLFGLPQGAAAPVSAVGGAPADPNIRYWNEPGKGGHFAAFEQPALFVDEVRSFFRLVR